MSTDLLRYTPPNADEWSQLVQTASMVKDTDFAPLKIRKSEAAIMATLLTGRELGIGPMQALRGIDMIEGKPSLSAQLMVGLVRARGHKIRPLETTSTVARVQGVRADDPEYPTVVEYTIEDARAAGLAGKDVWKKYPKSMLWARAVSQLCRMVFADVLAGAAYTQEELRDGEVDEAETTVTWIEPVQESGPAGAKGKGVAGPDHQSGRSGERGGEVPLAGLSKDPAMTPADRTETPAAGLGPPGPVAGSTPDASAVSGGQQAPAQVTDSPASEAAAGSLIDQMDSVRKGEAADWLALHSGDQELTKWFEMSANTSARRGRLRYLPPELKTKAEALLVRHLSATFDEPEGKAS
jgi:hypothetical protein